MLGRLVFFAVMAGGLLAGQSREEARKLKNPVAYSKESIRQGRGVYARYCVSCHGSDGKATVDVVADATDLTTPAQYKSGTSEGEIYHSISAGQGASMPSFKSQISDEKDLWHLVNFIRSLWPEAMRPPLNDSK